MTAPKPPFEPGDLVRGWWVKDPTVAFTVLDVAQRSPFGDWKVLITPDPELYPLGQWSDAQGLTPVLI